MELPKYPDMDRIATLYPGPQILLGRNIYWQEKRDGTQLRIALVDGSLKISTRNMEEASTQFQNYFQQPPQAKGVWELLREHNGFSENPAADFNIGAVVFGELLSKGKSPARFETHESYEFTLFDIYSLTDERFLPYPLAYSYAYHFSLDFVVCWGLTRHSTIEDLLAERDLMLEKAKEKGREGVVLKAFEGKNHIYAKEKLDTPTIERIRIDNGAPQFPCLPDSEVYGAVAKAHADLGELFTDKTKAMPLIAKYVGAEQEKHLCSKPIRPLFAYYQGYLGEFQGRN